MLSWNFQLRLLDLDDVVNAFLVDHRNSESDATIFRLLTAENLRLMIDQKSSVTDPTLPYFEYWASQAE